MTAAEAIALKTVWRSDRADYQPERASIVPGDTGSADLVFIADPAYEPPQTRIHVGNLHATEAEAIWAARSKLGVALIRAKAEVSRLQQAETKLWGRTLPTSAEEADSEFRKMPETPALVGNAYLHAFTPPEMSVDVLEVGPNGPRVARLQEGAPPIYDVPHDRPCPKSFVDPEAVSYDPEPEEADPDEYEEHSEPVGATEGAKA